MTRTADPVLKRQYTLQAPFDQPVTPGGAVFTLSPSARVGLHPQLLSFDTTTSYGLDVGFNGVGNTDLQLAAPGQTAQYQWYAGLTGRDRRTGKMQYTPVEFGSVNLLPADQPPALNGLYGAMVVETGEIQWTCDGKAPTARANRLMLAVAANDRPHHVARRGDRRRAAARALPRVRRDGQRRLEDVTNPDSEETRAASTIPRRAHLLPLRQRRGGKLPATATARSRTCSCRTRRSRRPPNR